MKAILFALVSTVAATNAFADIYISPQQADLLVKEGKIKPLTVLENTAKNQVKGTSVIYSNFEQDDDTGVYEYEAKIRDAQNTVWEITVNAQNGSIMEVDRDD